jgi:hypothetical protein
VTNDSFLTAIPSRLSYDLPTSEYAPYPERQRARAR